MQPRTDERGIVIADLDPTVGHEQRGKPAVVRRADREPMRPVGHQPADRAEVARRRVAAGSPVRPQVGATSKPFDPAYPHKFSAATSPGGLCTGTTLAPSPRSAAVSSMRPPHCLSA